MDDRFDGNPELTREEAIGEVERLAGELYRAEDRVAFVREMLDRHAGPIDPQTVRSWLDHQHCPRVESEQEQIGRLTVHLDLATEFRIPCPEPADPGRPESAPVMCPEALIVRKSTPGYLGGTDGWTIINPNFGLGENVWTGSAWVYRGELHREVIYRWTRDEAIAEAQRLAVEETARFDQWLAEMRAGKAQA